MILTLITFIIVLSILVLAHEFGHFLVAKKSGIRVEEFGLGLPPRIWSQKIGETIYSLNALPIGGFVKLEGEDLEASDLKTQDHEHAFFQKSKKIRGAVIVAGVTMNFLLAILAFSLIYSKLGIPVKTDKVRVLGVLNDSPAQKAGLLEGDVIVAAEGQEIKGTKAFIEIAQKWAGRPMTLEVSRSKDNPCQAKVLGATFGLEISCQGENLLLRVVPRENPPAGEGPLGVVISQVENRFYPFWQMIPLSMLEGFKEAFSWLGLIVDSFATMISQLLFKGIIPQDVAGPIGIFQVTGMVVKTGFLSILQLLGILSINLAVLNILPLPALDGGRLAFVLVEAVTGKKPNAKLEARIHAVGMIFLLFLLFLVTVGDILRLLNFESLMANLKNLLRF